MALPTKERTWNSIVYSLPGTGSRPENGGKVFYALKEALLTANWTVVKSCDRSSVSGIGVDLWTDYTKVLWDTAGNTLHSWIVLQAPATLHSSLQLLIGTWCTTNWGSDDVVAYITAKYSFDPAGFTGGTTSADPTAPNTVTLRSGVFNNNDGRWANQVNDGAANNSFNFIYSSDGEAFRCFFCVNGAAASFFCFERAEDLLGGSYWDTEPVIGIWPYQPSYAELNDASKFTANLDGTPVVARAATLGWGAAMYGQNQNLADEIGDGGWSLNDIFLVSTTTGSRGKFGRIKDLFFTATSPPNGSTMPLTGEWRQFAKFGDLVTAWDGTPSVQGTAPDIG